MCNSVVTYLTSPASYSRRSMEEMTAKNEEMLGYVATLKDFDVLKALELSAEQQATLKATQDDADSTISSLTNKVSKVQKAMVQAEEKMESSAAMVDAALVRVDDLATTAKQLQEEQESANKKQEATSLKLKELDTLKEDFAVLKAIVEDNVAKLKMAGSTNMSLLEVTGDHEARLEQMTELLDQSDAIVEQKMLKMQAEITDVVAAKQSEVEALVANMQENIEIMSLGVDAGGSTSSKGGAGAGVGGRGGGGVGPSARKTLNGQPGAGGPGGGGGIVGAGTGGGGGGGDSGGGAGGGGDENGGKHAEVFKQSADFIADLCINFEEIAVRKSYVNDIPSAMCENIATTAQQMAQYIAHTTDCDAVQMALRNDPGAVEYDDTLVGDLRQKRMEEFIEGVFTTVHMNHSKPGAVRGDARKAFMQSLRKAMDLCMSKHDQVLVVSNSRFGRVKVPSCIACDRPLVDKVRQDRTKPADSGPQRDFPGFPQFGQQPSLDDSIGTNSLVGGAVTGSPVPRLQSRSTAKGAVKLPQPRQEKVVRPTSSHGKDEAVSMRNGMKAPKPGNNAFTSAKGNNDEFPEIKVSQSTDNL